jgi:hypothetical protein
VTRFRGGNEDSERTSAAGATDHVDGLRARETVGTSQHDGDFDVSEGRRDFLKGVLAASGTVASLGTVSGRDARPWLALLPYLRELSVNRPRHDKCSGGRAWG